MPETAEVGTVRLMKPSPRTTVRLTRSAIQAVANKDEGDYMQTEYRYTSTRSKLAHLLAHDRFHSHVSDLLRDLTNATRELLAHPDALKKFSHEWMQGVTAKLEIAGQVCLKDASVHHKDIKLFLQVIEQIQEEHVGEGYDASGVIDPQHYALAQLVNANFTAYEKTLNT